MAEVTRILSQIEQGEPGAAEQLLPLVYQELRRLAARNLQREKPGHTLQATALVHEAYVRLVAGEEPRQWSSRYHFFSAAAEAMRRILVEDARRKQTLKHGGTFSRCEYDESQLAAPAVPDELLAVDEALHKLADVDAQAAQLVTLRYFSGLTLREAAEVLDISPRTADRLWAYARAWLRQEIHGD
jgi:RNA polymerase sigma factor (TIGR02999 family)